MTGANVLAGIDIGGTTTHVVLCTEDLELVASAERPTPASEGGPAMVGTAASLVRGLVGDTGTRLVGAGVGAAGVVDTHAGRIVFASDSFVGWTGFPVTETLETALGVPAHLDNDVNAFLRGEVSAGAVAGETDVLAITLGTGVGGALWLDSQLYEGPHGAAGEIGHCPGFGDLPCTCGGRGHLETRASGRMVAARYEDATGERVSAVDVFHRADRGDEAAMAVFRAAGSALATAITMVTTLLDVTTVVIGGGVSGAWHLLRPAIAERLAEAPPVSQRPIRLERSALGASGVALGAASGARDAAGRTATGSRLSSLQR